MRMNASLTIPHGTTKDELIAGMEAIPGDAVVTVKVTGGDRPFESSTQAIAFNWER